MSGGAVIEGDYRYRLWRDLRDPLFQRQDLGRICAFVMLNPSTADADQDDPTLRRCTGFARQWSFDWLEVVNLYGLRATDPDALNHHPEPVGELNDAAIAEVLGSAELIVFAWGSTLAPRKEARVARIQAIAAESGARVVHLGVTKDGHPRHPLYVPAATEPVNA